MAREFLLNALSHSHFHHRKKKVMAQINSLVILVFRKWQVYVSMFVSILNNLKNRVRHVKTPKIAPCTTNLAMHTVWESLVCLTVRGQQTTVCRPNMADHLFFMVHKLKLIFTCSKVNINFFERRICHDMKNYMKFIVYK